MLCWRKCRECETVSLSSLACLCHRCIFLHGHLTSFCLTPAKLIMADPSNVLDLVNPHQFDESEWIGNGWTYSSNQQDVPPYTVTTCLKFQQTLWRQHFLILAFLLRSSWNYIFSNHPAVWSMYGWPMLYTFCSQWRSGMPLDMTYFKQSFHR